jgi:hypothetical protein
MRKKKQKADSMLKTIAIMRLAKSMNCTFEEAAGKLKAMSE